MQASLAEIDLAADSYSAADCLLSLQASLDDQIDAQLSGYPAPPPPSIAFQRRSPARRGRGGARDAPARDEGGEEKVDAGEGKRQLSIGQLLKESILRDRVPAGRDVAGGEDEVPAGRDIAGSGEPLPGSERAPGGTSAGVRSGPSAGGAEVPGGAQGVGSGYVGVTGPLAHVACRPFMVKKGKKLPENWDGAGGTVALIDKPKGRLGGWEAGRLGGWEAGVSGVLCPPLVHNNRRKSNGSWI